MGLNSSELSVINTDGTVERVYKFKDAGQLANVSWSPDGKQILFMGGNSIFVTTADGANTRKISNVEDDTALPFSYFGPSWSPDGKYISFFAYKGWEFKRLVIVDSTTGEEVFRSEPMFNATLNRSAVWAPSSPSCQELRGTFCSYPIAYQMSEDGDSDQFQWFTSSFNIGIRDGSPYIRGPYGSSGMRTLGDEKWGDDTGSFVWATGSGWEAVYTDETYKGLEIFNMRLMNSPDQLTHNSISDENPIWSPDGEWIAYRRQVSDSNYLGGDNWGIYIKSSQPIKGSKISMIGQTGIPFGWINHPSS